MLETYYLGMVLTFFFLCFHCLMCARARHSYDHGVDFFILVVGSMTWPVSMLVYIILFIQTKYQGKDWF